MKLYTWRKQVCTNIPPRLLAGLKEKRGQGKTISSLIASTRTGNRGSQFGCVHLLLRTITQSLDWMDASVDYTRSEEGTTSTALPEYNTNSVKKARLESTLLALLTDPILADVPNKPTLSDVDTLINLELGSAMRITILKMDGSSFDVAVMDSATVKDLKLAIKKKVNDLEESTMGHRHISWKHVWANFCLAHHSKKLLSDTSALQDYGVRNNSQVQFVPYVVSRAFRKHSRRRKHRFFHGLNRKA